LYTPVSHATLRDALMHLRELYGEVQPETEIERRAQEAREVFIRNLISNLPHRRGHPLLRVIKQLTEHFALTLDGAHKLFGYNLDQMREYDLRLNGGRTRIIESYAFGRDRRIHLPLRFASDDVFARNALLGDLVVDWQENLPIRVLDREGWRNPDIVYIQVGQHDGLGSALPPGAIAAVELFSAERETAPCDPRHVYLLQFGNGYRCSMCLVSRGKLYLTLPDRSYSGPLEFAYPGGVRIVGRIRMFAVGLPIPSTPSTQNLPQADQSAPLVLPWEQRSLASLLRTEDRRFRRPSAERQQVRGILEGLFRAKVSSRTERRYRQATTSSPHVNVLMQLCLERVTRYIDALQSLGFSHSDRNRYSLETLLETGSLNDLPRLFPKARTPTPEPRWVSLRQEWGEWPVLLSSIFTNPPTSAHLFLRLQQNDTFQGLEPLVPPGAVLMLETARDIPDTRSDHRLMDWNRPIYVLHKGKQIYCGYLEVDHRSYTLVAHPQKRTASLTFHVSELDGISKVIAIASPA
jgi:hypothetical protein